MEIDILVPEVAPGCCKQFWVHLPALAASGCPWLLAAFKQDAVAAGAVVAGAAAAAAAAADIESPS